MPIQVTQERIDEICDMVSNGKTIREICAKYDCSPASIMRWVGLTPEWSEQYTRARDTSADTFESLIIDAALSTDSENAAGDRVKIDALKWVAARRAPKRYSEKFAHEHTGANGGPILTKDVSDLTDEELAALVVND